MITAHCSAGGLAIGTNLKFTLDSSHFTMAKQTVSPLNSIARNRRFNTRRSGSVELKEKTNCYKPALCFFCPMQSIITSLKKEPYSFQRALLGYLLWVQTLSSYVLSPALATCCCYVGYLVWGNSLRFNWRSLMHWWCLPVAGPGMSKGEKLKRCPLLEPDGAKAIGPGWLPVPAVTLD